MAAEVDVTKGSLSEPRAWTSLLTFVVLSVAALVGFASRLFAVIRFESIIHEFDPWFNYRATAHMVDTSFYEFLNWFDERAWYPLGRIVGGTVYPGLMVTSGLIHYVLHLFHIPVHIREICVFLAPLFSGLTAVATYLLTKELWSSGAGLFAACFIGEFYERVLDSCIDLLCSHCSWLHITLGSWLIRQRGHCYLRAPIHILSLGESAQERQCHVGGAVRPVVLLHGGGLGWLRVHHQSHSDTRSHAAHYGTVLVTPLRLLHDILFARSTARHAGA